jgi:SAM-dependent methyltransferase
MSTDVVTVTVSVTVTSPSVTSLVLKHGISATTIGLIWYGIKSGRFKQMQQKLFTTIATRFTSDRMKAAVGRHRQQLFASLQTLESADPALRSHGPGVLRILEIGVGDGANLKYYPSGCKITSVEPNSYFESYFQRNSEEFPHLSIEKFICASAEDMRDVEADSMDVVVSTHVLCSVTDVLKCLKEISRVLVPGGRFYYLEHISYDWDADWLSAFSQLLVDPVWSLVSDGCRLRRDPSQVICSQFTSVKHETVIIDDIYSLMKPHVIGVAQKRTS